jgi:NADH-quinone oxidoreductase subunit G
MTDAPAKHDAIDVTLNGATFEAEPGELLIDACERNGVFIPRFCYHPRMTPVGMCRMCLVEVDTGRGAALQPSCMLTCTPGMIVQTESELTKKAQDGVLEFLLINHPLDCPICDKGGECPLQDQTMSYGPGESRFVEQKRHFEKPIPINENVYLDRERCILCDRCTRFASEVAGDPLIHFQDRGNNTQVNTFPDEPFASYFSGNTVQICPVGALTAKPYRFKARPWDLEEVTSTYPNPMGDRISVQSSRDKVLRIQGVDSDATNWGWLTDRDRFSFEAIHHPERLTVPLVHGDELGNADADGDELVAASWAVALQQAGAAITAALDKSGPDAVGVLGGARLSNEAQYAWAKLAKSVIGTDNVDAQLDDGLPAAMVASYPRRTLNDALAPGSAVVLMSEDPKEQFGTLYLRLRHALQKRDITLVELTPTAGGLGRLTTVGLHPRPGETGVVARALVDAAAGELPTADVGGVSAAAISAAASAVHGRPVTVVCGRASLAESAAPTIDAAAALRELPRSAFLFALRRGNSHGAIDMGLAPGLLPGRVGLGATPEGWATAPTVSGLDARGILDAAVKGDLSVLVLVGSDPLTDFPDPDLASRALATCDTVIAVDLFANLSVASADIVLPAAGFAETSGTHTNFEGRISPLTRKVTAPGVARPDWVIASDLALELGADLGFDSVESVFEEIVAVAPSHAGLTFAEVAADNDGAVVTGPAGLDFAAPEPTPVVPLDGYSLRLVIDHRLYDNATLAQHCPSMANLAEVAQLSLHPLDADRLGAGGGSIVTVISAAGSIEVPVRPDTSVPRGSGVIPVNRTGADPRKLIDHHAVVTDIRVASS